MQFAYPGTGVDVAEIDTAVTNANHMATGLPRDTPIKTYFGDARQFVELNQDSKQYDLIFGDAFNDFSVPWHLTTREFNEKIKKMMTPNGVYMINIIDVYESDAEAARKADKEIEGLVATLEKAKQELNSRRDRAGQAEGQARDRERRVRAHGCGKGANPSEASGHRPSLRRVPRRMDEDGQGDLPARLHLRDR